jgi:hypothetical protein
LKVCVKRLLLVSLGEVALLRDAETPEWFGSQ